MEKLKPLEIELKRLEDLSQDIVTDFAYMKAREEEMRNTNGKQQQPAAAPLLPARPLDSLRLVLSLLESTNSKVLYFSVFSMCCLLGLAVWQVLYLRRYFKAKKLIE